MAACFNKKWAAVVGAGIGGLSAAAQLARAGWEVDLYEAQSYAGGKAGSQILGDYRFDTGPYPWNLSAIIFIPTERGFRLIRMRPVLDRK